jgi:hypothetical protein
MLDEFRNSAASFIEDEEEPLAEKPARRRFALKGGKMLGMTAPQRFLVSLLLFMVTTVFGALILLVTNRIYLP